MRAIVVESNGGPEVLVPVDREDPAPGAGEVLVGVAAAGVNFMDVYLREGRPPYGGTLPVVPGDEGAGTVAALGDGVEGIAVGDRVAWTGVGGSYASRVAVPAARAVPVPDGVDLETAAAVMLQGTTAHYLTHSTHPVAEGDVVVVHAAAGGVGLLLVQLAVRRGGLVVATTSTPEKAELARQAGAQRTCTYEELVGVVREVSNGRGADVVYDGVGAATFDASLEALRVRGILVLYGGASGPVPPVEATRLMQGGSLYLTRPTLRHYIATREELVGRTDDLFGWIADGSLDVRIGATYPLDDARQAHEDLQARRTTGKLLLVP